MFPPWDRDAQWGKWKRGAGNNNFHYGLACIAAYLEGKGHSVEVCDPQFFDGIPELRAYLIKGRFDIIGVTTYVTTVLEVKHLCSLLRETLPKSFIILGGPHFTFAPEEMLKECPQADVGIVGEGEVAFHELLCEFGKDKPSLGSVKNLVFRDNGKVIRNPRRVPLCPEDFPVIPAYKLFPMEKYEVQPTVYKRLPTFNIMVSRGCPYQCTFCNAFEVMGRKPRYKPVELVMEEIDYLIGEYGIRGLMFHDSTFTINRNWVQRFCEALIRGNYNLTWMCLTRVDCVDGPLLTLMKRAGCFGLSYGVESANQKSLDLIKKNLTVKENETVIKMSLKMGLFVTATYLLGLPGENVRDVKRTIRFAKRLGTQIAHFFLPLPYPGTEFFEQCQKDGGIEPDPDFKKFSMTAADRPVYVNPRIGWETMMKLQEYAIRSYYFQPNVILRNVMSIDSWDDVKKYLKAALAISGYWL